ncbi:MAG: hypothetical protein LQ349_001242 [Xanthoria aureola]|nr:MAG: hypothetical protein LQ349_001242 [Xanthoria aureola]
MSNVAVDAQHLNVVGFYFRQENNGSLTNLLIRWKCIKGTEASCPDVTTPLPDYTGQNHNA